MGFEDDECEKLRQEALASMGRKSQKKGQAKRSPTKPVNKVVPQKPQHRPNPTNKNLIEIQTTSNELDDPDLVDEILIAEGLDISDSDCDEVVEEVICSDDESENEIKDTDSSASPNNPSNPQTNSVTPESNHSKQTENDKSPGVPQHEDAESSPDEDALSVCSKYSLFDDQQDDLPPSRPPLKTRVPPQTTNNNNQDKVDQLHSSSRSNNNHHGRRPRESTRSRSRSPRVYGRKDNNIRRRRSRSRSPFRRRPVTRRSRSRDRDFRNRRTVSRERSTRITNDHKIREKGRRREEGRRPGGGRSYSRSPPPKSSRRNHYGAVPSRRTIRSRTNSHDKSRVSNKRSSVSDHSSSESHKSLKLAEFRSSIPSGVDHEVFEKRRRKFQDQGPMDKVEGKKIRLHSKAAELEDLKVTEHEQQRARKEHESSMEVQKSQIVVLKPRKRSEERENEKRHDRGNDTNIFKHQDDRERSRDRERKIIRRVETSPKEDEREETYSDKICEGAGEDQEDLRAKLIKRKLRAQGTQGQLGGSGRIFTEALKGTRLLSKIGTMSKEKYIDNDNEKSSSSSSKRSKGSYQDNSSSSSSRKSVKRKVRLVS